MRVADANLLRAEIADRHARGQPPAVIAAELGCARSTVYKIVGSPGPDRRGSLGGRHRLPADVVAEIHRLADQDPDRSAADLHLLLLRQHAAAAPSARAQPASRAVLDGRPESASRAVFDARSESLSRAILDGRPVVVPSVSSISRVLRQRRSASSPDATPASPWGDRPDRVDLYVGLGFDDYDDLDGPLPTTVEAELRLLRALIRHAIRQLVELASAPREQVRLRSQLIALVTVLGRTLRLPVPHQSDALVHPADAFVRQRASDRVAQIAEDVLECHFNELISPAGPPPLHPPVHDR